MLASRLRASMSSESQRLASGMVHYIKNSTRMVRTRFSVARAIANGAEAEIISGSCRAMPRCYAWPA